MSAFTREQLESDEAFMAAVAVIEREFGDPPYEEAWYDVYGWIVEAVVEEIARERITHGRHCTCSACAAQDWAEPQLAACGMHGPSCPPVYAPLGAARDRVP